MIKFESYAKVLSQTYDLTQWQRADRHAVIPMLWGWFPANHPHHCLLNVRHPRLPESQPDP